MKNPPALQETRVPSLVWEDPTGRGATKPMCYNHGACVLESGSCNFGSCSRVLHSTRAATALSGPHTATRVATLPRLQKTHAAAETPGGQTCINK